MASSYFVSILREHGATPHARSRLVAGTGLGEDSLRESGQITLGQQLRQIRNAARYLDPDWAVASGARFHPSTHGPVGIAAVSAPSLRDALAIMTRFSQVRSPHFCLRAHTSGSQVRLAVHELVALTPDEQQPLLDIVLLSTQAILETILGRQLSEAHFELPDTSRDDTQKYAAWLHAPVRLGRREAAVVFPRAWLVTANPLADAEMHEAARRVLLARERVLTADRLLVARVEQLLAARGAKLSQATAAALLGTSSRTLTRRLASQQTCFQALREECRRARAESLLADPTLTVAEVAFALGYEDAANFGRAFRRWFGRSPGQHRRAHAG